MKDILIIRMKRLRNLKLGKKFQRKFLQLTVIGGVNCTEGLHSGYFGIFEENKLRSTKLRSMYIFLSIFIFLEGTGKFVRL